MQFPKRLRRINIGKIFTFKVTLMDEAGVVLLHRDTPKLRSGNTKTDFFTGLQWKTSNFNLINDYADDYGGTPLLSGEKPSTVSKLQLALPWVCFLCCGVRYQII